MLLLLQLLLFVLVLSLPSLFLLTLLLLLLCRGFSCSRTSNPFSCATSTAPRFASAVLVGCVCWRYCATPQLTPLLLSLVELRLLPLLPPKTAHTIPGRTATAPLHARNADLKADSGGASYLCPAHLALPPLLVMLTYTHGKTQAEA